MARGGGVFGMLAIALALYCVRNVAREDDWSRRLFTTSFWGLNVGLAGMVVITLTPVGVLQMMRSAEVGFWSARSLEFYEQPLIQALSWARIVPDAIFVAAGILPLVAGLVRAWMRMRPATPTEIAPERARSARHDRRSEEELVLS